MGPTMIFSSSITIYSLPVFLDKVILYFYSAFGGEIFRYITTSKLESVFPLSHAFASFFNTFAPRHLYVSMASFSPFMTLIPILAVLNRKIIKSYSVLIVIGLTWFFLWSSSITYTRVFISGSLVLSIPGVILYAEQVKKIENFKRSLYSKRLIWALGGISIGYCILFFFLLTIIDQLEKLG